MSYSQIERSIGRRLVRCDFSDGSRRRSDQRGDRARTRAARVRWVCAGRSACGSTGDGRGPDRVQRRAQESRPGV
eukprot:6214747-Pleurochrysis_carterae.AAC.1